MDNLGLQNSRGSEVNGCRCQGQSKDEPLVAGIKEWTGEAKDKFVNEFFTQIETDYNKGQ